MENGKGGKTIQKTGRKRARGQCGESKTQCTVLVQEASKARDCRETGRGKEKERKGWWEGGEAGESGVVEVEG